MAIENTMDNIKKAASGAADKGKDWYHKIVSEIEGLAKDNSQDSKQKLLNMAKEHGVDVNENMSTGEIKNKIKAKLRDKMPGS